MHIIGFRQFSGEFGEQVKSNYHCGGERVIYNFVLSNLHSLTKNEII